ncbi:hypothetical protein F2P79_017358 [Pimephales promelas]|nr:hypothetical protein F2P79_017358 [Pimephales promelas]
MEDGLSKGGHQRALQKYRQMAHTLHAQNTVTIPNSSSERRRFSSNPSAVIPLHVWKQSIVGAQPLGESGGRLGNPIGRIQVKVGEKSSTSNDRSVAKLLASLQSLSISESDSSCLCGSQKSSKVDN